MPEPSPQPALPTYTFISTAHPGSMAWQWIYARAVVRPLAMCMLPVMLGGLVTALQGYPVLAYLFIGFPGALLVAVGWTFFRMHALLAEVHVRPGEAAIRTVWETLRARPLRWASIYELRAEASTLTLALGDAAYELNRASWPEADTLLDALRSARAFGTPQPW